MPKIAISYRRADSSAIAGRIFDHLTAHYGDNSVFMDIDKIPFGTDFRKYIDDTLRQCDVIIAVIGANWLGMDAAGRARMEDKTDPVRVEIETAVAAKKPIIPVLVDGAKMPDEARLPPGFGNFAYLNAAELTSGREFRSQLSRLIGAIDQTISVDGVDGALLRPALDKTQAAVNDGDLNDNDFSAGGHWRIDVLRYFLVPLALLLVVHYVIDFNNFNNRYVWLDSIIVSFVFGFTLFLRGGHRFVAAVAFAVSLGLLGSAGMSLSNSVISGDPLLPQTGVEWRSNLNVAGAIALSYVAGHALARAMSITRRWRSWKPRAAGSPPTPDPVRR